MFGIKSYTDGDEELFECQGSVVSILKSMLKASLKVQRVCFLNKYKNDDTEFLDAAICNARKLLKMEVGGAHY